MKERKQQKIFLGVTNNSRGHQKAKQTHPHTAQSGDQHDSHQPRKAPVLCAESGKAWSPQSELSASRLWSLLLLCRIWASNSALEADEIQNQNKGRCKLRFWAEERSYQDDCAESLTQTARPVLQTTPWGRVCTEVRHRHWRIAEAGLLLSKKRKYLAWNK